MQLNLETDDAFEELNILRSKAEAALYYVIDEINCPRAQTLTYVATDYLSAMGKQIHAMQESGIKAPYSPVTST